MFFGHGGTQARCATILPFPLVQPITIQLPIRQVKPYRNAIFYSASAGYMA